MAMTHEAFEYIREAQTIIRAAKSTALSVSYVLCLQHKSDVSEMAEEASNAVLRMASAGLRACMEALQEDGSASYKTVHTIEKAYTSYSCVGSELNDLYGRLNETLDELTELYNAESEVF